MRRTFLTWLHREPKTFTACANLAFVMALTSIIYTAATAFIIELPDWQELEGKSDGYVLSYMIVMVLLAPLNSLIEEFVFRAPLSLVGRYYPGYRTTLPTGVALSMAFGWMHAGPTSLLAQGVIGLILTLAYLKCGGLFGKFWKPFLVVIAIHTMFNWVILSFAFVNLVGKIASA